MVEAWDGTLAPGEETEIALTFRPGSRAVGVYEAVLQAFTAETGEAVEVPLTMEVTPTTAGEDEAETAEAGLSVYPNPVARQATVTLAAATAGQAQVAVFDVLGRRVAVLHDGETAPGVQRFGFEAARLPAGVYLVRAEVGEEVFTERVTVVR